MILLIDIGNTLTKIATSSGKIITDINNIAKFVTKNDHWKDNFKDTIIKIKNDIKVTGIIISSVVTSKNDNLSKILKIFFDSINPIIVNSDIISKLPIKIKLSNNEIGSDFLALAVASAACYGDNITISLGTATTYSIIKNNEFLGAIIAPGFNSSKKFLVQDAELLTSFNVKKFNSMLGQNTLHALSIGFGNGFNYMLKSTIEEINKELKTILPVIIAGNGFNELKKFFNFEYEYNNNLVMIGLVIIYQNLVNLK